VEGRGQITDIAFSHPSTYIKYHRGIERLSSLRAKVIRRQFRQVYVAVLWGEPGVGKTRRAIEMAGPSYYILDMGDRVWFDGYDGEDSLIIDDFYGWIKHGQLLRILDGHEYRCEIKGSFTYAAWSTVIITSNRIPESWYQQPMGGLSRRINEIIHME